jgi:hypothetical protein
MSIGFFKRLGGAFKAFFKAWREPENARIFLEHQPSQAAETADLSHLRLLFYLQQSGRLIDFLKEDITPFSDVQVGAAARKIHEDCAQIIDELIAVRPLRDEPEGATIQIPKGYNPAEIKVVGKVKGEPPFAGLLVHRGWKAQKRSLPKKGGEQASDVICPAEVEIKS